MVVGATVVWTRVVVGGRVVRRGVVVVGAGVVTGACPGWKGGGAIRGLGRNFKGVSQILFPLKQVMDVAGKKKLGVGKWPMGGGVTTPLSG